MKKLVQLSPVIAIIFTASAYGQENIPSDKKEIYTSQGIATDQSRLRINHFHDINIKAQQDEFWVKYPGTVLSFDIPAKPTTLRSMWVLIADTSEGLTFSALDKPNYSTKAARELQKLGLTK